jgi:hypothetical protein
MDHRPRAFRWIATCGSFVLLLLTLGSAPTQPTSEGSIDRSAGTVISIDRGARTLAMISGTGHALRLLTFRASTGCRIEISGTVASFDDLARGRIVVVRHRKTPDPYEALSIEAR